MTTLIASSFGALGAFVIAAPVLLFALALGLAAGIFRLRWLSLLAGLVCLATTAWLFAQDRRWLADYERYPKPSVYAAEAQQAHADLRWLEFCSFGCCFLVSAGVLLPRRRVPGPLASA